jgi:hypothetical protein
VFELTATITGKIKEHAMNCASTESLFALAQNQLAPVEADGLHTHLSECRVCKHQFDQLQKLVAATATRELVELPAWLSQQAMNLFDWHQAKSSSSAAERTPAILVVDSLAEGRLLGFRGAGPQSRQMLYRAGNYDIDLSLDFVEQTQSVDIMGQPMPVNADISTVVGAQVKLMDGAKVVVGTQTNEFGEFIIDGVREGLYQLEIEFEDKQIDIVGLNTIFHP